MGFTFRGDKMRHIRIVQGNQTQVKRPNCRCALLHQTTNFSTFGI